MLSDGVLWGWGRWGTKRRHYRPSPAEIHHLCWVIRERGYRDARGHDHPPWSEYTELERRVGQNKPAEIPNAPAELNIQIEALGELNGESI